MAQFDLFIDTTANALVAGLSNQTVAQMPLLVQGDTPTFRIWLLAQTATFPLNPYTLIPTAGLSLEVTLGSKIGSGGTIYTQQLTWAASTDPNNPNYWIANFALNTAAITTLLGSGPSAPAWFEVKYVSGGLATTVLQVQVTVNASIFGAGVAAAPPGFNPASVEYVNATFLTRQVSGQITLVNPNTGKKIALYLGDDGTLHADPLN